MPTFNEDVIVNGVIRARDGFKSETDDWEIVRNGENLEIREPEQANKVWARFNDDNSLHLIGTPNLLVDGRIGIGTTSPAATLHLNVGNNAQNDTVLIGNTSNKGLRLRDTGAAVDIEAFGIPLFINNGGQNTLLNPQSGGNVGIGTINPQAKLHVNGSVFVTDDIVLQNADCAEEFDVSIGEAIEPGTVMVLNPDGQLQASWHPYDKRVVGVVSGAGNFKPGLVLDKQSGATHRMPIALMGKVYCKVDAQYASIEVGDLLTTSPTPGHAMKAIDAARSFGTVIGKALQPLESGTELIPILIALQ